MIPAIAANGLGKRFGKQWALRDCSLQIAPGSIVALVGPNGAGKTTLLQLAVGLTTPTSGEIQVLGHAPRKQARDVLPRVGFVAQDHPLYRRFTVENMLTMGRKLNPRWDDGFAMARMRQLAIPLTRPTGQLSGGQQAQVALVLALAKRPELVVLDEPIASLDPLARREFLQTLLDVTVEHGLTVVLSSHILADLERTCDTLIILAAGQVQLTGDIEQIVAAHRLLVGPRSPAADVSKIHHVIHASHTERQTSLLVRTNGHLFDATWDAHDVSLEEIVLAYLGRPVTTTAVRAHDTAKVEVPA